MFLDRKTALDIVRKNAQSNKRNLIFPDPILKDKPTVTSTKMKVGFTHKKSQEELSVSDSETKNKTANPFHEGESNILVTVRVRPLLQKEKDLDTNEVIRVLDSKVIIVLDPGADADDVLRQNRSREKRYAFDRVFDFLASQIEVYNHTVKFLLDGVMNGFNATVFTYGATGSGKTYTMLGTIENPGLMFITLEELFSKINEQADKDFTVTLSYLEVYNENIRDLLNPDTDYLELREDAKGIKVVGITEYKAKSVIEIMELLRKGNKNRTQEPTNANEESSRSHAVLQVIVEQKSKTRNTVEEIKIGKLSLIDLAGSERASASQNRGMRLIEGANINRSLLALGNCINALGDRSNKGSYVPYRDSKLTRLLKDSLGGNCRTVMIATVGPRLDSVEDTINTLKYANRAKNIQVKITRNVLTVSYHVAQYTKIISDLRTEIDSLKNKLNNINSTEIPTDRSKKDTFESLKKDLLLNFDKRVQLSKSIYEIEVLEYENSDRVSKIQKQIQEFQKIQNLKEIHALKKDLSVLNSNMKSNSELKLDYQKRLDTLENETKRQRLELGKLATTNEMKQNLEMLYKIHVLEIENMELVAHSERNEKLIAEKDKQIQKLMHQKHTDKKEKHLPLHPLDLKVDEKRETNSITNSPGDGSLPILFTKRRGSVNTNNNNNANNNNSNNNEDANPEIIVQSPKSTQSSPGNTSALSSLPSARGNGSNSVVTEILNLHKAHNQSNNNNSTNSNANVALKIQSLVSPNMPLKKEIVPKNQPMENGRHGSAPVNADSILKAYEKKNSTASLNNNENIPPTTTVIKKQNTAQKVKELNLIYGIPQKVGIPEKKKPRIEPRVEKK